jgi:DNA-binding CsgD family transcriptional regulator
MTSSTALDVGRAAVGARRWAEAYERLVQADTGEGLTAPDVELLATVASLRGESEAAVDALTRAHEAYLAEDDQESAARTAAWLALKLIDLGDYSRSAGWVARAQRLADGLTRPSAVAGLAGVPPALAVLASGDPDAALRRFEEIAEIAELFHDRELAALAALGQGQCLIEVGSNTEGLGRFDEAMVAVTAGEVSPIPCGIIYCAVIGTCHLAFDLRRAIEWTSALDHWCRSQQGLIAFTGQCHAHRAALFLLHGAWTEASAAAELAESRYRAGDLGAAWGAHYQLAEVERMRGEFRAAERHYARAAETPWEPQPGLALLHLADGRTQLAQSEIRRSASGADQGTRRHLLPAMVEIEIAAGDLDAAHRAAEELDALARAFPTPMLTAIAAFASGQVLLAEGDAASAFTRLRAAAVAWRALDAPYEAARCRMLIATAFRALGDEEAAATEFDAARDVFLELGAAPALADLGELVGGHRPGPLTDREVEVLRLVSTGLTNRGVAVQLSLSEKTVARHLSNIFGKLGISSRSAATAYAYEHGLV